MHIQQIVVGGAYSVSVTPVCLFVHPYFCTFVRPTHRDTLSATVAVFNLQHFYFAESYLYICWRCVFFLFHRMLFIYILKMWIISEFWFSNNFSEKFRFLKIDFFTLNGLWHICLTYLSFKCTALLFYNSSLVYRCTYFDFWQFVFKKFSDLVFANTCTYMY